MKEFFKYLATNWWGIIAIVAVGFLIWLVLSIAFYRVFFKRFYDILLSFIALVVFSPLLLILTAIGAIAMRGNPFFVQKRPGKINKKTGQERIILLIKFRTMSNAKDLAGNLLQDEKRLNRYGLWLRKSSLDELPSLLNILMGEISIVGPRPQLVRDMVFMTDEQRTRHNLRPGLTGLAQVSGRNNITWEQKFEYDLQYVNKVTFFHDLKILFMTVGKVLKGSDTVREGTVSDIDFGDWLLQEGKVTKEEYDEKQKVAKKLL